MCNKSVGYVAETLAYVAARHVAGEIIQSFFNHFQDILASKPKEFASNKEAEALFPKMFTEQTGEHEFES